MIKDLFIQGITAGCVNDCKIGKLNIEGIEECMSYMVGVINENGCVIATDSLITVDNKYTITDFTKVFSNKENNIIWGVIGNYGYNEELLDSINDCLKNKDIAAMKAKVLEYSTKHSLNNITLNIFFCEYLTRPSLTVIDFINGEFYISNNIACGAYYAGNNSNMHHVLGTIKQVSSLSIDESLEKCQKIIKDEIEIEEFIFNKNPFYQKTIGGDCKYVMMKKDGIIEGN